MTRITLLVAAVLGVGLVFPGSVWASDPTPPNTPAPALNLTPSQQQRLNVMENASHAQAGQLIGQIKVLRGKLSDLYGAYSFDAGEAKRLNREMNKCQGQLLDLRLSEQQQLRGILSPDQFTQLQAAIHQHEAWGDHRPERHDMQDRRGREGRGNSPSGRFPF